MIPPFLAAWAARIGIKGAIVIGVCLVLAAMAWRYDYVSAARDKAEAKVAELRDKLKAAGGEVEEARAINQRMRQALEAQTRAADAAIAANAELEQGAAAARAQAAARQVQGQAADVKRRARSDLPTPAEMTAVIGEIVGGM